MGIKLSKSDIAFVKQMPVCRLATATEECEPVVRPVWAVFDGANIYIASDPDTPKLEHIEANPQVSMVFDDYDKNNWSNIKKYRIPIPQSTRTGCFIMASQLISRRNDSPSTCI